MHDARKLSPAPRPPLFVLDVECGGLYVFPSTEDAVGDLEAIDIGDGIYEGYDADGRRLRLMVRLQEGFWGTTDIPQIDAAEETPSAARELADILRRGLVGVQPADALDGAPLATLVALAAREPDLDTGVTGHPSVYTGHRRQADGGFPMRAWIRAQEELTPLEPLIDSVARELSVELLGDREGKSPWPSRGVGWRRGFDEHEVRVSVSPRYFESEEFSYVLSHSVIRWSPWFLPFRPGSYTETKRYSPEELRADPAAVVADLRALVLLRRS